jgi:rRNA-processing protein FCF1
MKIVVNDANILFDLLDIDLVSEFCRLPYEKMITEAVLSEFDDHALQA